MKKKILVFFMIFILIFTFSINIFGATNYLYRFINRCDVPILWDYSTSSSITPVFRSLSPNSSTSVGSSSTSEYLYIDVSNFSEFVLRVDTSYNPGYSILADVLYCDFDVVFDTYWFYRCYNFSNSFIVFCDTNKFGRFDMTFYSYLSPPFYQPFLDFNNQVLSNTWSFFGDLFGDSYLNLTIFVAGLFFILLAIMIVYSIIRRATHIGG